ncbi:MAG TPA: hypothetical protein VMS89_03845 [Methanoregulaceae archaeon]|nr:hypothetical protein [Methanoregulaceae archaeon]
MNDQNLPEMVKEHIRTCLSDLNLTPVAIRQAAYTIASSRAVRAMQLRSGVRFNRTRSSTIQGCGLYCRLPLSTHLRDPG